MTEPPGRASAFTACLHGAAHLTPAGGERLPLERKQALLLAYLWLEGPTPRGKLARLLWPDAADARARGNLRQRLAVLRQAAGADLVGDAGGVLSLSPSLTVSAAVPAGPELLGQLDYDDCDAAAQWLEAQREAERSTQRAGTLRDIRESVRAGSLDEALRLADRLLAMDRESEEAYRAQMEVLYLRGDTAAAIAVWDRCKEMLRQLYGVAPSATTRQLGETILAAARRHEAPVATAAADAIPVTVLRPPRLVGRQPALQAVVAAWRAGTTPWVCGDAGVGKSRLLAEFAAAAGPCAFAAARPGDGHVPYASLERLVLAAIDRFEPTPGDATLRAVAHLLPRLADAGRDDPPPPAQTDHERRQSIRAVALLLAACTERGCAALVLDDLQFADTASIEAVVEMATRPALDAAPLRFVLGTRWDEPAARAATWLSALGDGDRFRRVDLVPLDAGGVAELVESLGLHGLDTAALAERLWRQVGGNPAFVLESVKLVLAMGGTAALARSELPIAPDVVSVIEQRVALLSAPARHLAQLAAIAGQSYSVPLAAAALACTPLTLSEPLRELELRQVLYGRQFVHDVIAVGVRRTIPRSVAEFMHRFVAEWLESHDGPPAHVAAHWKSGGEPRRAGVAYRAAAQAAAAASRPLEQSELLDAAAACFEESGDVDALFDVLEERQAVHLAPDAMAARLSCMERMDALARNDEQRLRALLCRQGWDADHARTAAAEVGLDAAERALALGLPRIAFEFGRATAWRLALGGDEARAVQTLEAHRDWVMAHGEPAERGDFHSAMSGVLGFVDRLAPAVEASRQAAAELRAGALWPRLLPALSNLGLLLHWRGELVEARAALAEARELRDRMHGQGSGLVIDIHLGAVQRDLGEFVDAERTLQAVVTELRRRSESDGEMRIDCVIAENQLAHLWLSLGQPERALDALQTDDAPVALRYRSRRVALRLRVARHQSRAQAHLVTQAEALRDAIDSPFHRALFELELARAHAPARALPVFERLLLERVTLERPGLQLHAAARAAHAALALGHADLACRHIESIRPMLVPSTPFDADRAEVWLDAAEVLQETGSGPAAGSLLEHGERWLRRIAATLPDAWNDGFVRGHPANAALLRLAHSHSIVAGGFDETS